MRVVLQILERIIRKKQTKKEKKITFHSASNTNHTNICRGFYFKKRFDVLIILVATGILLYLTPS